MAIILQGTAYSIEGTEYTVYLEKDMAATAENIDIRNLQISYQSADEELDTPVLASTLKVAFSVPNSSVQTKLEALALAQETDYTLRVLRGGSLYWVGYVLLDFVRVEDRPFPYDFELQATDGIGRLAGIDYAQANGTAYSGKETIQQHLQNVVAKIGLESFYGTGDPFLLVHSTIWEDSQTADDTANPLLKQRFSHRALRTVDRRGNIALPSCRTVLEELCRLCGARFMYSDGVYIFTEVNDYARSGSTIYFQRYDRNFTALTNFSTASWADWTESAGSSSAYGAGTADMIALSGGNQFLFPPLRSVEYTYKHYSTQNLIPGTVWKETSFPTITVEDVDHNSGATRLAFSAALQARVAFINSSVAVPNAKVKFRVSVRIVDPDAADWRLQRDGSINANGIVSYGAPQWFQGDKYYEHFAQGYSAGNDVVISQAFGFISPDMPISGDVQMQVFVEGVYDGNTVINAADYNLTWSFTNNYLEALIDGSLEGQYQYTVYTATNNQGAGNSKRIEREVLIGDGPTGNAFGSLEYQDDVGVWQLADGWRRYDTGGSYLTSALSRGDLLASEVLSMQSRPVRRMELGLIAPTYRAHYRLNRLGYTMILQQGRYDLSRDEWSGTWVAVARYASDVSTEPQVQADNPPVVSSEDDIDPPPPPPPPAPPPLPVYFDPTTAEFDGALDQLGINTSPTDIDNPLTAGDTITAISPSSAASAVPLYDGDVIVITNPTTGGTQTLTVTTDYELGTTAIWTDNVGPASWVDNSGNTWISNQGGTDLAVESTTLTEDFPAGSYVQVDPQWQLQMIAELRRRYELFALVERATALTTGVKGFWRPGERVGYRLRGVDFRVSANGSSSSWTAVLKHYDGTSTTTVATYTGSDTGGVVTVTAGTLVAAGEYYFEVTSVGSPAPTGLHATLQLFVML